LLIYTQEEYFYSGVDMKKFLILVAIIAVSGFSLNATAAAIPFESLESIGKLKVWLLVGLGLLCFIELRRGE